MKKISIAKKIIFILLPFLIVFVVGEIAVRIYQSENPIRCDYADFERYGYCPNYTGVINTSSEGVEYDSVEIFVDKFGGRQLNSEHNQSPNESKVFIIGDSFIQAKKVPYESTIYGILNKSSIPTYALGFSSWNPIQYNAAIEKIGVL